jgi:ArsR family transcriptional regulator
MNDPNENSKFSDEALDELASLLKILAEPNRLLLLEKIMAGVLCNCDLGQSLSLSPNLVSHHLSVLCDSGLVDARRSEDDGRWIFYSINMEKLEALNGLLADFFDVSRVRSGVSCCGKKITVDNGFKTK